MKHASSNPETLAKQMLWLAFRAAKPVGMGHLQASLAARVTADDVCRYYYDPGRKEVNADYAFGRMMKLFIRVTDSGIEYPDSKPHPEYQSWCRTYPTYEDLILAATAAMGSN